MQNYRWKISNEIFCVNFFSQMKELEKQKKAADVYLTQIMRKLVCSMAPIHRSLLDFFTLNEQNLIKAFCQATNKTLECLLHVKSQQRLGQVSEPHNHKLISCSLVSPHPFGFSLATHRNIPKIFLVSLVLLVLQ